MKKDYYEKTKDILKEHVSWCKKRYAIDKEQPKENLTFCYYDSNTNLQIQVILSENGDRLLEVTANRHRLKHKEGKKLYQFLKAIYGEENV